MWTALFLSAFATIVAVCAVIAATREHDPLGKGIGAYDLSTPESSAKSTFQIEANRDLRAQLDLDRLRSGDPKDAVRTLEINRVADFVDKKVLFVSYVRNGQKQKQVLGFEKSLESRLWLPKHISPYDVQKTNEQLAKDMRAWDDKDSE